MTTPPRAAEALLSSLGAHPTYRDAVLGDLAEEFNERAAHDGAKAARWWYCGEAIRTAPHLVRNWAAGATWADGRRVAGAVVTGLVGLYIIAIVVGGVAAGVMMQLGISLHVNPLTPAVIAVMLTVGIASSVLGGYLASSLDRETPLISAIALALLWCAVDAVAFLFAPERAAWQAFVPALPALGATLGGMLRVARRANATAPADSPG